MYLKLSGIVLHVIKYSDKNSIAHIYTDTNGRMAFLIPQGNTKNARMRNAAFMPLSIVQFEARILPGRDIHTLRDVRTLVPLTNVYADPAKNAIALFISELLARSIQESEENAPLFSFIKASVRILNDMDYGIANFHLWFLFNLGAFLGIQPDTGTFHKGYWFDMDNGVFSKERPFNCNVLRPDKAEVIYLLSRMTLNNIHRFRFNRNQRNEILDTALSYYRLHNSTIGSMKSPEILKMLFD